MEDDSYEELVRLHPLRARIVSDPEEWAKFMKLADKVGEINKEALKKLEENPTLGQNRDTTTRVPPQISQRFVAGVGTANSHAKLEKIRSANRQKINKDLSDYFATNPEPMNRQKHKEKIETFDLPSILKQRKPQIHLSKWQKEELALLRESYIVRSRSLHHWARRIRWVVGGQGKTFFKDYLVKNELAIAVDEIDLRKPCSMRGQLICVSLDGVMMGHAYQDIDIYRHGAPRVETWGSCVNRIIVFAEITCTSKELENVDIVNLDMYC